MKAFRSLVLLCGLLCGFGFLSCSHRSTHLDSLHLVAGTNSRSPTGLPAYNNCAVNFDYVMTLARNNGRDRGDVLMIDYNYGQLSEAIDEFYTYAADDSRSRIIKRIKIEEELDKYLDRLRKIIHDRRLEIEQAKSSLARIERKSSNLFQIQEAKEVETQVEKNLSLLLKYERERIDTFSAKIEEILANEDNEGRKRLTRAIEWLDQQIE